MKQAQARQAIQNQSKRSIKAFSNDLLKIATV